MEQKPIVAAIAIHLAGAAVGALLGAMAGVAGAFTFAPHAALYLSAINGPLFAGFGLIAGLLTPEWSRAVRLRLYFALTLVALAGGCQALPSTHFINGQLLAEMAREER